MGRLLIRRILLGIVVTWVVSMMIFAATELLPGDVCHAAVSYTHLTLPTIYSV